MGQDRELSGALAAKLAYAAYDTQNARDAADAKSAAQQSENHASYSSQATVKKAFMGRSGAVFRKNTGFCLSLDRTGGHAGEKILSFRGTNFESGYDWSSNAQTGMTQGPGGVPVHAGFMKIYAGMKAEIDALLQGTKAPVHFVGHSLGGALATLAALDHGQNGSTYLYTFGCPRIGGLGINAAIDRVFSNGGIRRVYALNDPVPMVPIWPFRPAGRGQFAVSGPGNLISKDAHSMKLSYIPAMQNTSGWQNSAAHTGVSSIDRFLDLAEKNSSVASALGYFFLGEAMKRMIQSVSALVQVTIGPALTVIDSLAVMLESAAQVAVKMGERLLRLVKIALKLAGAAVYAVLTVADLTRRFLRFVLDRLYQPVLSAAAAAIRGAV
jgi:pimeloyl-ACP methyl ester carboxylesterase